MNTEHYDALKMHIKDYKVVASLNYRILQTQNIIMQ